MSQNKLLIDLGRVLRVMSFSSVYENVKLNETPICEHPVELCFNNVMRENDMTTTTNNNNNNNNNRDYEMGFANILNKKVPNGVQLGLEQTADDSCATFSSDVSSAPGISTICNNEYMKTSLKLNKAFCNTFSVDNIKHREKLFKEYLDYFDNTNNINTNNNLEDVVFLEFLNKVVYAKSFFVQDKTLIEEEFCVIPTLFIRVYKAKFIDFLGTNELIQYNNEMYSNEYISNLVSDLVIDGSLKFVQKQQEGSNNKFCKYSLMVVKQHSNIRKHVFKKTKYSQKTKKEFSDSIRDLICSIPKRHAPLSNLEIQQEYQLSCSELSLTSIAYNIFSNIVSKLPSSDPAELMRSSVDIVSPFMEKQKDFSKIQDVVGLIDIDNSATSYVRDRVGDIADSDKVCLTDELNPFSYLADDIKNTSSFLPTEISGCDRSTKNIVPSDNLYQMTENNISKGSPSVASDGYDEFTAQVNDGNVKSVSPINNQYNMSSTFPGSELTEFTDINEMAKCANRVEPVEETTILSDDIEDIANKVGETKKEVLTPIGLGLCTAQRLQQHQDMLRGDAFSTDILSARLSQEQTRGLCNTRSAEDTLLPNDPTELATRDNTDEGNVV